MVLLLVVELLIGAGVEGTTTTVSSSILFITVAACVVVYLGLLLVDIELS